MTTAEQTAVQAVVLADLIGLAAEQQTSRRLSDRLASLAAALSEHAGDLADRLNLPGDAAADDTTRRVALAMLDPAARVTVDPADRDALIRLLGPQAARSRCSEPPVPIIGQLLTAALNRVAAAASGSAPAPSNEVIAHELQLHENECPADPPVRVPSVLECPCGRAWLVRCSKCAGIMRTVVNTRCEHLEDTCTGLVDEWRDVDATTA